MSGWPFSHPWALVPMAALALLALGLGLLAQGRPGLGVRVVGQRPWLLGLGAALILGGLGLGMAGPRFGLPEVPRLTVQVVIDASRSMTVADAGGKPRWDAAVSTLDRLWSEAPPGVRFGVDLLTGDSVPLLPPGEDRALLRDALKAVKPGEFGSPGTSMGRGLPQVASQVDKGIPAVILFLGDGEETWEARNEALARATQFLKEARLPVYTVAFGSPAPQPVAGAEGAEPAMSKADPDFLRELAEGTGGKALDPKDDLAALLRDLAHGKLPLPMARSHQPAHPEWGAWLALLGLGLWLLGAGKPMRAWRVSLGLLLALAGAGAAPAQVPLPQGVKAWLAQGALERGDLQAARRWMPLGNNPNHRLLAAQIQLRAQDPHAALATLLPLTGLGVPRPVPAWRATALLMAARAHLALEQKAEAIALMERLLKEEPGRSEAVHNLQSLLQDTPPPPKTPPPPPPPRPSQGARQDELEGIQQKLPEKQKPPAGVKDL